MSMAAWLNKLTMGLIPIIENARERNPDIIAKEARGRSMRFKRIPRVESVLKYIILNALDDKKAARLMAKLLNVNRPIALVTFCRRDQRSFGIPSNGFQRSQRCFPIGTPNNRMEATVMYDI